MQIFVPGIRVELEMALSKEQLALQIEERGKFGWRAAGHIYTLRTVEFQCYAQIIVNTLPGSPKVVP